MRPISTFLKEHGGVHRYSRRYQSFRVVLPLLLLFFFLYGCDTADSEVEKKFGMRTITRFEITPDRNPENIHVGHIGLINQNEKVITINVPKQADLTAIRPTIEVAPFASVSPSSFEPVDLSDTVEYIVTAQNGRKSYYSVVCKNDYLYTNATLMAVTVGYQLEETTVNDRILIPSNNKSITHTVPAAVDLTNIKLTFEPDPFSHFPQYFIGSKKTDFAEPIDFTAYPAGLQLTVISENNKNFAVYTIKLIQE